MSAASIEARARAELDQRGEVGPNDYERAPLESYAADVEDASAPVRHGVEIRGFTTDELLAPIEPERSLLPGVPTEAYTLIAGPLSAYKSTFLHYLGLWRGTGFDLLNLDPDGPGCDIGPVLLVVYEDFDRRFRSRTQRIVQHAHAGISSVHGKRAASDFLARIERNFRRVILTGQVGATLVCRSSTGAIVPNEPMLDELRAAASAFAKSNLFIGIDPLRLAITGSQNDDEVANVVVHVLNRIATWFPDSGLVIPSHTTKGDAKEGQSSGYTSAAYGTSGSALYSQHARSNFLISRLNADKARELLDVDNVPAEELERQPIAQLTHGRLSHGGESPDRYFRNVGGALVPVRLRSAKTPAQQIDDASRVIVGAVQRLQAAGVKVTGTSLLTDEQVQRLGSEKRVRSFIKLAEENAFIEFRGSTKDRVGILTDKGRAALATNGNESGGDR